LDLDTLGVSGIHKRAPHDDLGLRSEPRLGLIMRRRLLRRDRGVVLLLLRRLSALVLALEAPT
jgi:hypothetical protein